MIYDIRLFDYTFFFYKILKITQSHIYMNDIFDVFIVTRQFIANIIIFITSKICHITVYSIDLARTPNYMCKLEYQVSYVSTYHMYQYRTINFPSLMYHVSCIMCHVSCVMCHVSCIMCHVSCIMCHVSCVMCHVSCVMYHVSCIIILINSAIL